MTEEKEQKESKKEETEKEPRSISDSEYKLITARALSTIAVAFQEHNLLLQAQNELIEKNTSN